MTSAAQSVTLSFTCQSCGVILWFESPWDIIHPIDLECASCSALYLIQVTQPLKRKREDLDHAEP